MKRKTKILLLVAIGLLVLTNILTVAYHHHAMNFMRQKSSFQVIALHPGERFKECLDKNHIENKLSGVDVMVREVDRDTALSSC